VNTTGAANGTSKTLCSSQYVSYLHHMFDPRVPCMKVDGVGFVTVALVVQVEPSRDVCTSKPTSADAF